jgi:hypothetical protein
MIIIKIKNIYCALLVEFKKIYIQDARYIHKNKKVYTYILA